MINTENMIPCDDGLHLIQLDENISHYGWVFRKVEGGWPYSVRKATPHEMAHAKARQHLRAGAAQIVAQYQPAEQPQGEPVALPARKKWVTPLGSAMEDIEADGWNACLDEIEKLGPLFARADPGEVERLRAEAGQHKLAMDAACGEIEALRAELTEAHGLLRGIDEWMDREDRTPGDEIERRMASTLSASAEPSAQCVTPVGMACPGDGVGMRKLCPSAPVERDGMARMVDAAMVEMSNIYPPLKRSDCERLIRAALERKA